MIHRALSLPSFPARGKDPVTGLDLKPVANPRFFAGPDPSLEAYGHWLLQHVEALAESAKTGGEAMWSRAMEARGHLEETLQSTVSHLFQGLPLGQRAHLSRFCHSRFGRGLEPPPGRPLLGHCLLYTSPSPRDGLLSRMPSSA